MHKAAKAQLAKSLAASLNVSEHIRGKQNMFLMLELYYTGRIKILPSHVCTWKYGEAAWHCFLMAMDRGHLQKTMNTRDELKKHVQTFS